MVLFTLVTISQLHFVIVLKRTWMWHGYIFILLGSQTSVERCTRDDDLTHSTIWLVLRCAMQTYLSPVNLKRDIFRSEKYLPVLDLMGFEFNYCWSLFDIRRCSVGITYDVLLSFSVAINSSPVYEALSFCSAKYVKTALKNRRLMEQPMIHVCSRQKIEVCCTAVSV